MTVKEEVALILNKLPENTSIEEIQYHLYFLEKIHHGLEDVEAGRLIPAAEAAKRLARWLSE